MFFKQIVHDDLGCASYMVCSTQTGECAVVDPRWEVEPYLETAERQGFRCDAGHRSVVAAGLLERAGVRDVLNVELGMTGWRKAGLPEVRAESAPVENELERTPVA